MATRAKKNLFTIDAVVTVQTNIQVTAGSLEEAVQHANTLNVLDFVSIVGDHNDSKLRIVGAYASDGFVL